MPYDKGPATNLYNFRQGAGSCTVYLPGYQMEINLLVQKERWFCGCQHKWMPIPTLKRRCRPFYIKGSSLLPRVRLPWSLTLPRWWSIGVCRCCLGRGWRSICWAWESSVWSQLQPRRPPRTAHPESSAQPRPGGKGVCRKRFYRAPSWWWSCPPVLELSGWWH